MNMVLTSFNPTTTHIPQNTVINDPYIRVDMECKDHNYLYFYYFKDWSKSAAVEEVESLGEKWVQINPKSASASVNLIKTVNIGKEGWYRIRVRLRRGPKLTGTATITIAGTQLDDTFNPYKTYYAQDHISELDYGLKYLNSGNTAFQLTITKDVMVKSIRIQRIEKYSTNDTQDSTRLNIKNMEWTQNGVSELNTATTVVGMKEDYYDLSNDYSRLKFDYGDQIRIYTGQNYRDTKCVFGGYLGDYSENLKEGIITLNFVDRLYDLERRPAYKNFRVGSSSTSTENNMFPMINFGNALDAAKYFCETSEIRLNGENIHSSFTDSDTSTRSYWKSFGATTHYDSMSNNGGYWRSLYSKDGNPKPCYYFGVGASTGAGYIKLFEDNSRYIDASQLNQFTMQYKKAGRYGVTYFPADIAFKMHTEEEAYDDATYYYVKFTGNNTTNVIGKVTPKDNNSWNNISFDLQELFDNYKPSSNYYISEISLRSTIASYQTSTRQNRAILIDNISMYSTATDVGYLEDSEVKTPREHLKEMCDKARLTAYVDYNDDPRLDSLVVLKEKDEIVDTEAREGVNILECGEIKYNPLEELCNNSSKSYMIDEEKTGIVFSSNHESYQHYDWKGKHETLTDIKSKGTAQALANNEVGFNKYIYPSFDITLQGTCNLKPDQYMNVTFDSARLTGNHEVKSIINYVNFDDDDIFTTQLDLGEPSRRFRNLLSTVLDKIHKGENQTTSGAYDQDTLRRLGKASPGGFIGVK
jgi:hypothetical protein